MKKRNTRSTLLVFLVCASISSAVYLNIVSSNDSKENLPGLEMQVEDDFGIEEQAEKPLPDVNLLKKVLRTGEKVLTSKL
ncbi:MAG: hypothetical protein AAF806_22915, partial [Bacteroidota bacterium]